MSGRVVAILVGVLALLIGAVVLTQPKGAGPNQTNQDARRLVEAPPSQIGAIEVREDEIVRVEQQTDWGGWFVTWMGERGSGSWPASDATRNAAARILSTSELLKAGRSDLSDGRIVIIAGLDGSSLTSMQVGDQALAGIVPIRLIGTSKDWHSIRSEVSDFLKADALLMWRDPSVLPGFDANMTSISIGHSDLVMLSLKRVGKSWSLTYPVAAPADPAAVQALLEGLIGLNSDSFTDAQVEGEIRTLTATVPGQSDRGDRQYTVIAAADSGVADVSLSLVAGSERSEVARTRLKVTEELNRLLDVDPATFISKRTLGIPASEIERFSITQIVTNESMLVSSRGTGGWEGAGAAHADAWCTLLTGRDADSVLLGGQDISPTYEISLERFGGLDLGSYEITYDRERSVLWIGKDQVWRGYSVDSDGFDLGLAFD